MSDPRDSTVAARLDGGTIHEPTTVDDELESLRVIVEDLNALDVDARRRIITYLQDRYLDE